MDIIRNIIINMTCSASKDVIPIMIMDMTQSVSNTDIHVYDSKLEMD